ILKGNILIWAMLLIALGLSDVFFSTSLPFIIIGCVAAGFGYGMAQPYIYDIAVTLASARKVTYTLALVMTMNYVAILISPFLVDWMQELFGVKGVRFPFVLNSAIGAVALVFLWIRSLLLKRN
ncbi:MAG: MFS transporter, partial [Bacteroidaceae bacterium]|nr:MFS transporter [Bacteroidaceae bacterium]